MIAVANRTDGYRAKEQKALEALAAAVTEMLEHKRAADALKENENKLALFIKHAPVAIAMLDADMKYISASRRWFMDYSIDQNSIIGRNHYEIFSDIPVKWKAIYQRVLSGAVERNEADPWRRTDDRTDWIHWELRPWYKRDKVIGGILIFSENITDLKHAEKELQMFNDELTAKNAELKLINNDLESFSYSVSHDLRGPLRTVSNFSALLLQGTPLDERKVSYVERIQHGTEKMSRLIDDLLRFSHISRQEIYKTETDLSRVVKSIITELTSSHPERNIQFHYQQDVIAFADAGLMEIVLTNLLNNAWKFTANTENAQIQFGSLVEQEKQIYYIQDNGVGFNQEYAHRMFMPFYRLHGDTEFQGSGIGLSLVERIIQRHGGKVWARGVKNEGATVFFTLD